ncbi:MAG: hypothetical protein PHG14_06330 [Desulfobacter postgatei]|uniref:RAMP superfamily CRISPR-associated protein n=1 Tax=Desulfobacter postgatei TaxID=2293 RepID=UPI0023F26379|nr:RAMP superfamily CRISPR-associated protein [Desulfobacter postgatei]MDD4273330.1 hypothetical protein [Desulfobacter postgatei]
MQKVTMSIHLTLKGPLLTQSSSPGELGLDLVAARKGVTFHLPATLVAGKLRQALEEIQDVVQTAHGSSGWFNPSLDVWLGQPSENGYPKSKQLFFSDFDLRDVENVDSDRIRDRIKINAKSGAVEKGQIVMIENPFISGEEYTFTGKLYFFSPAKETDHILKHVKTGFNWFSQIGAMKSIGFGQVAKVLFSQPVTANIPDPGPGASPCMEKIGLEIRVHHPFCISGRPLIGNLFRSETIIPGGALIGCIATTWSHLAGQHDGQIPQDEKRKALVKNFSNIRITHGFPSEKKRTRPVVAPLSMARINNASCLYDVALLSKPCLINDAPLDFALDWKDNKDTLTCYPWPYLRMKTWGWCHVRSELRIRTGIDRQRYRSKESELFAYEQCVPDKAVWYAQLDLSRIADENERTDVLEQLRSLLDQGIIGLGKTKTTADIVFTSPGEHDIKPFFPSSITPVQDKIWVITLQTDTLLGSPDTPKTLDENAGAAQLFALYRSAWEELSQGKLELVRYFARQKLSGGRYRKQVFQKQTRTYKPWLLTEAGSVFVLKACGDTVEAKEKIETWLNQGVPLTRKVCQYYGIDVSGDSQWQQCPFLPQNGYGEIVVNIQTDQTVTLLTDDTAQRDDLRIDPIDALITWETN